MLERPKEYVCETCNNIVAGVVHGEPPDHTYQPPTDCRACGTSDFVELDRYPSMPSSTTVSFIPLASAR